MDFLLGVELFQLLCDVLGDDSDVLVTEFSPDVIILVQDDLLHIACSTKTTPGLFALLRLHKRPTFSRFIFVDVIVDVEKIQSHGLNYWSQLVIIKLQD